MKYVSWIISVIALSLFVYADQIRLSDAEYEEIKEVSIEFSNQYPSDQFTPIFVGRSMTAFQGFLLNFNYGPILNLPISGMNQFEDAIEANKLVYLFNHFEKFIPKSSSKVIVFFDWSNGGKAYFPQKKYIDLFMRQRRSEIKYTFSALVWHQQTELIKKMQNEGVSVQKLKYTPKISAPESRGPRLFDSLYNNSYKDWAPYPQVKPWQGETADLKPRPEFNIFRKELFQYMRNDKEINCKLIL